ncbi:hypothetical protein [Kineococcus terrestris]|uniref:hypothetical protein n=1 Tax=Kineococcus terrestris TaxID=2044856 RepID=UPI0034DB2B1C
MVLLGALLAFALTLVLVQGVAWLFGASQGTGLTVALMAAVIVLVGAPLNVWVGTVVTRRVAQRLAAGDRLECSLRVVDGHQDGLARRWRPGVATLHPGQVTFAHTVGGLRFLRRRPITFAVQAVDAALPRQVRGAEVLLVAPGARVVQLRTPSAVLEWAIAPAERIDWVLERVQDAAGSAPGEPGT